MISQGKKSAESWGECTLPSKGVYYAGEIPGGIVKVRQSMSFDEVAEIFGSGARPLDRLLSACVELPSGFDVSDLLVGDRIFLLLYLRRSACGDIYRFPVRCNACGCYDGFEYDLSRLVVVGPKYPTEPVEVRLSDCRVGVRFMRGSDVSALMGEQSGQAEQVEKAVKMLVVGVDGVSDRKVVSGAVSRLSVDDIRAIHSVVNEAPGIDMSVMTTCKHCGVGAMTDIPITESFFRKDG